MSFARLNAIALAAWAAAAVWVHPRLPERYPVHFDLAGNPDGWANASLLSWLALPLIGAASAVMMHLVGRYAVRLPHTWNVPEKKRFLALSDEQRAPIIAQLARFLEAVSLGITGLLAALHAGMFMAATGQSRGLHWFVIALIIAFIVVTLWAALTMNRRVRDQILNT